jgi:outer membrane protein assembly factor BamA
MPIEDNGGQNSLRAGLIWDTRDREAGPRSGTWTSALVERADEGLGSAHTFTRWTLTDRRYVTLRDGLVFANRLVFQETTGDPPFYALSYVQSSFSAGEGLGGAGSLRGVLRNRYIGKGLFFWNAEVRWRFKEVSFFGKPGHLAAIGFLDSGRVWGDGLEPSSLLSGLHHGGGGGIRIGLGPNFVVAVDLARGSEAGTQTYIGLDYLF